MARCFFILVVIKGCWTITNNWILGFDWTFRILSSHLDLVFAYVTEVTDVTEVTELNCRRFLCPKCGTSVSLPIVAL